MLNEKRASMGHGVLLIALFSCAAFYIGSARIFAEISLSPMIIGIVLGMVYANSLRMHLPDTWVPGIQFCSKKILRLGIILYGFRLTFQDVVASVAERHALLACHADALKDARRAVGF